MINPHFNQSIIVNMSAGEVMNKICSIRNWWGAACAGNAEKLGDEFVIMLKNSSVFSITISALLPGKKIVWLVTYSYMPWYTNKQEWTNHRLVFDLDDNNGTTTLTFTHEGLTEENECWTDCNAVWNHWITSKLFLYLLGD